MKNKLLHILAVGLITLILLAPSTIVGALIWQRHLQLITAKQAIVYGVIGSTDGVLPISHRSEIKGLQQSWMELQLTGTDLMNRTAIAVQRFDVTDGVVGCVLFTPLGIVLGALMYHRYLAYRNNTFNRQVATLERLWQRTYRHR